MTEPIELTLCQQFDDTECAYWRMRMHVGSQSFLIGPDCGLDTREEIDMHAEMLKVALTRAGVADVRIGEVARPWDRLA